MFVHRFFMHHITLHCMLWFSALTPCLLTAMASEPPPDGVGSAFQSSDLDEPMTKIGFSNDVRAKLLEDNFDIASFAMMALTPMELGTIIKAYEADLQREFTRKDVAPFRQLWQFCQQKAQPAPPQPLAASASTAPPSFFFVRARCLSAGLRS